MASKLTAFLSVLARSHFPLLLYSNMVTERFSTTLKYKRNKKQPRVFKKAGAKGIKGENEPLFFNRSNDYNSLVSLYEYLQPEKQRRGA